MKMLVDAFRTSKALQLLLILAAAGLSLLPLAAERLQGNSIRWSVEGSQVRCEYFRVPSFSHVRSYDHAKIVDVMKAPDSQDPSVDVVRLRFNGLNYNIPSQSSVGIWSFDRYLGKLQRFMTEAKSGDQEASMVWYHPWLVVGAVSAGLALVAWVAVFTVLALGPPRRSAAEPAHSS